MAPKNIEKQKSSQSLEKYQHMTLDALINLENFDENDEELDEDEAFNSDDEVEFGKYFSSKVNKAKIRSKNLSLSITLPVGESDTEHVVDIAKGSKMTLSSVCLDVSEYNQVKLSFRCIYLDATKEQADDFCCLCNYLGTCDGGMGLMPSTPVNLEVFGPCTVEFRAESIATVLKGRINIFGVIVPVNHFIGADDLPQYTDAFMSEDEEIGSENDIVENACSNRKNEMEATKKRKIVDEPIPAPIDSAALANLSSSDNKLSKSARKKLAKEKTKQLEETLAAARGNDTENGTSDNKNPKKKKKKNNDTEDSKSISKPSKSKPLTRERRLAGGLVVSDIILGTGAPVKPGKRVSLHYTGSLRSTSKVFDKNSSAQHPLVFRMGTGEVIRGLERGLEGMKTGGERVVTIPSKLGYGSKGSGDGIPPDSDLVFEVKVLKVG